MTTRWTAARSCSGPDGSARSSSFSGREGGSACVRSICIRSSSRRRWLLEAADLVARQRLRRRLALVLPDRAAGLGAQPERAADPLHVDAEHPGALPAAPEGGDRQPREVAHRGVVAPRGSRAAPARAGASKSIRSPPVDAVRLLLALGARRARARPARSAAASAARKKKRSNTRSNTRRSSGDLAIVAASASRNGTRSVQPTSPSAAKASLSSEVPIATPSARSSSAKRRTWAGKVMPPASRRRARPPRRGRCGA